MASHEDAEKLFRATANSDPFPNIPPALLNSADIHDYIESTGMVYPYDPTFLKSSSYEAQIGDAAYYWDEKENLVEKRLDKKSTVKLEPNSLVFFKTKQKFRLPSYMAIRFNLRITNVHRGLLLGTGPLVDPGFQGYLLIPIHNLTNNTYIFRGDESFIWIEFTKLSPNPQWSPTNFSQKQIGSYVPFPIDKIDREPWQYFDKANNNEPIRNAVPAALAEARSTARSAKRRANIITVGGIVAALAAVIGFYPLITNSVDLSKNVAKTIDDFRRDYQEKVVFDALIDKRIQALEEKIDALSTARIKSSDDDRQ